jgi:adenine-specific DNA methylase
MSHIPGPWTDNNRQVVSTVSGNAIAVVYDLRNVEVIREAPSLYRALEDLVQAYNQMRSLPTSDLTLHGLAFDKDAFNQAVEALSRASGRTVNLELRK